MKKIMTITIFMFSLLIGVTGYSYTASQKLDYTKINQNLSAALNGVTVQFRDFLNHFVYRVNGDKTNIDKDQYSFSVDALLKKTPWVKEPTEVSLTMDMQVRPEDEPGIELGLTAIAKTRPVLLSKYIMSTADCERLEQLQGIQRVLFQVDCNLKAEYEQMQSIEDLMMLTKKHFKAVSDALSAYAQELKKESATIKSENLLRYVEDQMEMAQAASEGFAATEVSETEGGFTVKVGEVKCNKLLYVKALVMDVNKDRSMVSVTLRSPMGETLYQASRSEIINILKGLEQNKEFALEMVRADSRIFFNLMDAVLFTERKPME